MTKTNTIAIVFDDHRLFADSFSALIERLGFFQSVQSFDEERDLMQFLAKHSQKPIYLFLDYYLKDKHALPIINEAKRLNRQIIIIVMSAVISPNILENILTYNPKGLVSKSSGLDAIVQCIAAIGRGEQYLCPVISEIVVNIKDANPALFTGRELEILQYFANGSSIAQTAELLYLSKHTIVAHRRKMMAKAGVHSITELLAFARTKELI